MSEIDATPQAAMIFAAGLGTRMGALTRDRPKPLIEVGGRTLLDHALEVVLGAGASRIVVNTHAHAEKVAAHLARAAPEARIAHERERLETGGGLKAASPLLGAGAVFTLNADMVWRGPNPLAALAAAWTAEQMGALLALTPRATAIGHGGRGDFHLEPSGRLRRRGEDAGADWIYAGAEIIDLAVLDRFPSGAFSLNRVWDALAAEGRLFGLAWTGRWFDVGTPDGLALAEAGLTP